MNQQQQFLETFLFDLISHYLKFLRQERLYRGYVSNACHVETVLFNGKT